MNDYRCGNLQVADVLYEYFNVWAMDLYDIEFLLAVNKSYLFRDDNKIIKITDCGKKEWADAFKEARFRAYTKIKEERYSLDFYDIYVSENYVLQYMEMIEINKNLEYSTDGIITGFGEYIKDFYTTDLVDKTIHIMRSMWDNGVVHTDIFKNIGSRDKQLVLYDYDSLMTRDDYQYDPCYRETFRDYVYLQLITKYKNETFIPLAKAALSTRGWL
jgi:hypothetical protein